MNSIHPKIAELLNSRGITDKADYLELLSDKPQKTYDPFLLYQMREGVDFILSAIRDKKRICIYGDYDVDGITSIVILLTILSPLTDNLEYYIPSRFEEGYGLNKEALDKIKERGVDLVITVDLGSVAVDEVKYAKDIGLEILVTDHHSINENKADCLMINPKQEECSYPFKDLAGCGVAYKIAQGIQREADLPKALLYEILDVLGLGTIGDIVPLIDENRTFAKYGIEKINKTKRLGLSKLIEANSLKKGSISSEEISFGLVPHLNAAGRMKDAEIALKILIDKDESSLDEGVKRLVAHNRERRKLQDEAAYRLTNQALEENGEDLFYLLYSQEIHEGIAGIVAGKLKDYFGKPVAILTPSKEGLKGTARSIEKINLYDILKTQEQKLIRYGGHAMACGFLIDEMEFGNLRGALNEALEEKLLEDPGLFTKLQRADIELELEDIDAEFCHDLWSLAPFGSGWPKPIIVLRGVSLTNIAFMGAEKQHLRFKILDSKGRTLKGLCFNKGHEYKDWINTPGKCTIYGTPNISLYRGVESIEFKALTIEKEVI